MKKKVLSVALIIFTFFVNACSCNKFDVDTYVSAVKNFNNSTGFSYELTITTETVGEKKYYVEESEHKYRVTPTRVVENFASEIKKYEISTDSFTGNGAPVKIYELNRYYKGQEGKFYISETYGNNGKREVENTTYENKYGSDSMYNLKNLIPTFSKEFISDFNIEKHSDKRGYSVATFNAACPSYLECSGKVITYKVVINKQFYFDSIEFTFQNKEQESNGVNGENTGDITVTNVSYKYTFHEYNGDVEIVFPNDLVNY